MRLVLDPVNIDNVASMLLQVIKDRTWMAAAGVVVKK